MSRQRIFLLIPVAAIVVAAVLGAWGWFFRSIEVVVVRPERDVAFQVFGLGTVEARVTSKVGFKVSGILIDLQTDVRDRVPKGAILARLDAREQMARVDRAKATIEQAEANLQRAIASLEKAQANLANAKRINERRQTLLQSNNTSIETAETAKSTLEVTSAEVNLALGDVAVARASLKDAKGQEQLETVTLDLNTLVSPYDAMVITRQKELGSALAAGEAVFTLIDPQTVWVLAYIDESKAGEIRVGEPAEIVLRSLPGQRFKGRVARIEPEGDRINEERRVQVVFDKIPDDFHLGEQAEVYITAVQIEQAVLVPEAAVLGLTKSRATVWLVSHGRLEQREVSIGHRMLDGRLEILDVPDGASVLSELKDGLRVGRSATIAESKLR